MPTSPLERPIIKNKEGRSETVLNQTTTTTNGTNIIIVASNDEQLRHDLQSRELPQTRGNGDYHQTSIQPSMETVDKESNNGNYDHAVPTNVRTIPSLFPAIVHNETQRRTDRSDVVDNTTGNPDRNDWH